MKCFDGLKVEAYDLNKPDEVPYIDSYVCRTTF